MLSLSVLSYYAKLGCRVIFSIQTWCSPSKDASKCISPNVKLFLLIMLLTYCRCVINFTEQLLPCAAGNLFDLHTGQGKWVCGRDKRSWGHHNGGRCCQHLVDQRGLEGSFDAASHQVTQRNLEDVFTCCFTWEEETQRRRQMEKGGNSRVK